MWSFTVICLPIMFTLVFLTVPWKNHFIMWNTHPLEVSLFGTTQQRCLLVTLFVMVVRSMILRHPIYVVNSSLVTMPATPISTLLIILVVHSLLKMMTCLLINTSLRNPILVNTYWAAHPLWTQVTPCLTM